MKKIKIYTLFGLSFLVIFGFFLFMDRTSKLKAAEQEKIESKEVLKTNQEKQSNTRFTDANVPNIPLTGVFALPQGTNSSVGVKNQVIITQSKTNQVGSIFSTVNNKLDLTTKFTAEMYLKINGNADGITFAMHNDPGKASIYSGTAGRGLGAYADSYVNNVLKGALKNSFVVEFDTFLNNESSDKNIATNLGNGHVAYSYPDQLSSYKFFVSGNFDSQIHYGTQYPTFKLGDNVWRKFTILWEPDNRFLESGNLTYELEGMDPVTAPISRSIFNSDSVYWGFTGSTGELFEEAKVTFASVPGFVNYEDTLVARDSKGELIGLSNNGHEVTVEYSGIYSGGRQNLLNPVLTFQLTPGQIYQQGSVFVNGENVSAGYNPTTNSIRVFLTTRTLKDPLLNVSFKLINEGFSTLDLPTVSSILTAENYLQTESTGKRVVYIIDADAPTAFGNLTVVSKGDTGAISNSSDLKLFLRALNDNFTDVKDITASLKPNQDIEELVRERGPKSFEIEIKDKQGNARFVKVPIFVKDAEEKIVNDSSNVLSARNFRIKPIDYPKTAIELSQMIVKNSILELWTFASDGSYKQLDANLAILDKTNLPEVGKIPADGIYSIPITYRSGSSELNVSIEMQVSEAKPTVKVTFLNDIDKVIHEEVVLSKDMGSKIDLTSEPEVTNVIRALEQEHYEKIKSPDNETEVIVDAEEKTVTYVFKGNLYIDSYPSTMNFGVKQLNSTMLTGEQPEYDKALVIKDNRSMKKEWKLTATLNDDLRNEKVPTEVLFNGLRYKNSTSNATLLIKGQAILVEEGMGTTDGLYNISDKWENNDTGLNLKINPNQVIHSGKYKTSILWKIGETP